jgi:hypothetical protein
MPRVRAHPVEGKLQALLDGEVARWEALRLRLHLRRCAACRARWAEVRARGTTIGSIIRSAAPEIDTREAWARFVVRSGGQAGHRAPRSRAWSVASVALVLAGLGALVIVRHRGAPRPPARDTLLALAHTAHVDPQGAILRDACCRDHDGGDLADDGLLTLSRPGERVTVVVVYEDVDRSGTFTPGDVVRYISSAAH